MGWDEGKTSGVGEEGALPEDRDDDGVRDDAGEDRWDERIGFEAVPIEDLNREQRGAEAFLKLVLAHLLKLEFARAKGPRRHWEKEIRAFRRNFWRRTTPSVTVRLKAELDAVYDIARAEAVAALWQDAELEDRLPRDCPYDWEQVTGEWLP